MESVFAWLEVPKYENFLGDMFLKSGNMLI